MPLVYKQANVIDFSWHTYCSIVDFFLFDFFFLSLLSFIRLFIVFRYCGHLIMHCRKRSARELKSRAESEHILAEKENDHFRVVERMLSNSSVAKTKLCAHMCRFIAFIIEFMIKIIRKCRPPNAIHCTINNPMDRYSFN